MKTKTYNFYEDPGHGWMKVSLSELSELGIKNKISHYSYKRGDYAYLEEDCDMRIFYNALEKNGVHPLLKKHRSEKSSKIRSYNSYITL